ncbi:MAG: alkaline phosphatase D family protein [Verrucomicrobia bacterium]|nr:alkaline phosphatase D family protein [Verrucomicrobiota bacterium]
MVPRIITLFLGLLAATIATAQTVSPFQSGVWCGNVTATSGSVVARLTSAGVRVRLQVSTNAGLTGAVFSGVVTTAATSGNTAFLTVTGLKPDTDYYYGIEVAGALRTEAISRGRFHTFPIAKGSFKIAFSGDSDYRHPDQQAFDAIVAERPLLFIHLGDFHYNDTNSTVADDYRANYDNVLNHPNQGALYRSTAVAYMWGDHDFCGNDSDGTAIGRDAARVVYKERVPHYPIISTAGGTMTQAFTIGRVRVLMTDTRSAATAATARESASKTRLGTAQKNWFKQELIAARDSGFPMILWVNPDPWIGAASPGSDMWAGYTTERTEIANFIRDNRIQNVVSISADMHALAYDDGTNSDYATGGGAPITVLHAAALTAGGSIKGGPYTGGAIAGNQQYGILEVYDSGGPSVACRFLGMRVGEGQKLTYIFSSSANGAGGHSLVNISTLARISATNDSITSGFVLSGTSPRNVLIRAVGPTLSAFGVNDALPAPVLSVYQGEQLVATNSAWAGTADGATPLVTAFDRAGAFRLLDETSRDSALVLALAPGAYTVQVKSADGSPGSTLLEVYEVP